MAFFATFLNFYLIIPRLLAEHWLGNYCVRPSRERNTVIICVVIQEELYAVNMSISVTST